MIESAFIFTWYLLTASGLTGGTLQAEDRQECEAARQDKEVELAQAVTDAKGQRLPDTGWFVGACRER